MKEWLEVRCCCNPEIMLGHMAVARGVASINFPMLDEVHNYDHVETSVPVTKTVCLEVDQISKPSNVPPWNFVRYKAVKSGHLTLEQLKTLPDFMPA